MAKIEIIMNQYHAGKARQFPPKLMKVGENLLPEIHMLFFQCTLHLL